MEELTKKEALAEELGVVEEDVIEKEDNVYEVDGEEYLVLTDDEADKEFKENEESIIDDIGIESFTENFKDYIRLNLIATKDVLSVIEEMMENYVNDLDEEGLRDELESHGLLNEDEELLEEDINALKIDLIDDLVNEIEDPTDWLIEQFGEKEFWTMMKDYIDMDEIIDTIKEWDGRGPILAQYDGIEREIYGTDYYYYRID